MTPKEAERLAFAAHTVQPKSERYVAYLVAADAYQEASFNPKGEIHLRWLASLEEPGITPEEYARRIAARPPGS